MSRIYHDGISWNYTEYFDYIDEMANCMPPGLRDFAANVRSYSLHGKGTLHDSRVLSFMVSKSYADRFSGSRTFVEISLVDQLFEGKFVLSYDSVHDLFLKESSLKDHAHADVLRHEFSVLRPGLFEHQIILDHEGEIRIQFSDFSCGWTAFAS